MILISVLHQNVTETILLEYNLYDIFELPCTKAFIRLAEHVKTILLFYGLPKLVKGLGEQNLKICTYV